jgi:predicted esterase
MVTWSCCGILALSCFAQQAEPSQEAEPSELADSVAQFWAAETTAERDHLAAALLKQDPDVTVLQQALREGRRYWQEVARGELILEHTVDGQDFPFVVLVPQRYDASRSWPVRFELHGGMGARPWKPMDAKWTDGRRPSEDMLVIVPAGWRDAMWWERSQVRNFEQILRRVRASWNINEDRVVLSGNSDGGAATFFQAMRTPDPWAGYIGFVGPPDRLARAEMHPDGQMHVCNLAGQRFHLGYGGKDKLVPWKYIEQYLALFEQVGARVDWFVKPNRGHSLDLSEAELNDFTRFLYGTVRDPLPDHLVWACEEGAPYTRRSWLILERLHGEAEPADASKEQTKSSEAEPPDVLPRWGTRLQLRGPSVPRLPYGKLEAVRTGNRVRLTSTGVEEMRLLISTGTAERPEFDLSLPIEVEWNGKLVYSGMVEPSAATLLHWAARDDDRRCLFVAELRIPLRSGQPPSEKPGD